MIKYRVMREDSQMKRLINITIILLLVLIANLSISFAADSYTININGKIAQFTAAPKVIDGVLMVPTKQALTAYGATVTWDAPLKAVVIKFEDQTLVLPTTKGYALLKDIAFNLQYKTVNGVSYIETDVFKRLGASVTVNSKVYTITRLKTAIKEIPGDERIWLSINDYTADLTVLKTELDSLRAKLKALPAAPYNETTYMITGDVVYDDSNSTIIYGIAYGFGSGMHEGYIQVLKPYNGSASFGKFVGFNAYVGSEFSLKFGEVKTYKKAAATTPDPNSKVRAELNTRIYDLQQQYDTLSNKEWTEDMVRELSPMVSRAYNEASSYTLDFYSNKFEVTGAYEFYGYSNMTFEDADGESYDIQVAHDEDDEYWSGFGERVKDVKELINKEDGIVDAFIVGTDTYGYYEFQLFMKTKDNKMIHVYLPMYDVEGFDITDEVITEEELSILTNSAEYKNAVELLKGIDLYYVMG